MANENLHPNFIEGPSAEVSLEELTTKHIIPTFCDNTLTLSSQKFIEATRKAAEVVFGSDNVTPAEIRGSHIIAGRVPSAQHKKASELLDEEKTLYYQRLAWISHITTCASAINGQEVSLTIGGTRNYAEDKLYGRQTSQHVRLFVGWRVRVCSNMLLTCDGVSETILCMNDMDVFRQAMELFQKFNSVKDATLTNLEALHNTWLTQEQFCKILGRLRLYLVLPSAQQKQLPQVLLGDSIINAAIKGYITNKEFGIGSGNGNISCWMLMNLLNEAAKSSYIDLWIDRNRNCTDFAMGIANALQGNDTKGYDWFLN